MSLNAGLPYYGTRKIVSNKYFEARFLITIIADLLGYLLRFWKRQLWVRLPDSCSQLDQQHGRLHLVMIINIEARGSPGLVLTHFLVGLNWSLISSTWYPPRPYLADARQISWHEPLHVNKAWLLVLAPVAKRWIPLLSNLPPPRRRTQISLNSCY